MYDYCNEMLRSNVIRLSLRHLFEITSNFYLNKEIMGYQAVMVPTTDPVTFVIMLNVNETIVFGTSLIKLMGYSCVLIRIIMYT
jgi:hypothetical protein